MPGQGNQMLMSAFENIARARLAREQMAQQERMADDANQTHAELALRQQVPAILGQATNQWDSELQRRHAEKTLMTSLQSARENATRQDAAERERKQMDVAARLQERIEQEKSADDRQSALFGFQATQAALERQERMDEELARNKAMLGAASIRSRAGSQAAPRIDPEVAGRLRSTEIARLAAKDALVKTDIVNAETMPEAYAAAKVREKKMAEAYESEWQALKKAQEQRGITPGPKKPIVDDDDEESPAGVERTGRKATDANGNTVYHYTDGQWRTE